MTKDYFQEKYNCNSSLIFHYFNKFKNKNIQQIDNIIQERQLLKEKTQNIMTDKTGNDIKEFFNNTTRAYQFVINLFKIMEDKILVQDRTVDKCIKIINKYEDKMRAIHITDNIILNQTLADEILKIAHEKNIIKSDDVLNGCDYFTYYPNTKIVSFHIKNPLFWEDISLKDFLVCYEEIDSKKGCMMRLIKDLGLIYPTETSKSKRRYGIFECPICKQEVKTAMYHVKTGNSTKCKSCATKINKSIHGGKGTRLYGIWKDMKKRCYSNNKNSRCYKDYRSRGIKVCKEWKDDFTNFRKWSLENGYKENLTIDRIKNDKDYTPTNCRWTTYNIQARNTRRLMITNKTGYRGVSYSIKNRKFKAQITVNNHVKHLGFFYTKEEAAEVYDNFILENNLEHTTNKDNK